MLVTTLICNAAPAQSAEVPPPAYQSIAIPEGVPSEVLYAIAMQESGTKVRGRTIPWPWTLNVAGIGYRFATRSDACRVLQIAIVSVGPARVDVGLGQTNMRANGHRYTEPCEGLDPHKNLRVTAQILAEQKTRSGSWIAAAGRYHRPAGGAAAARYRRAFTEHLSRITGINLKMENP
jgi:hypothetical protein